LQIKRKNVSCHTADSKPVKQEVNGTVILPPLVFPGLRPRAYLRVEYLKASFATLLANISLGWNGLPGTNTNLLQIFINYGCKMFYNIGPRCQSYKTFFDVIHQVLG
jgi:hypothetical protein